MTDPFFTAVQLVLAVTLLTVGPNPGRAQDPGRVLKVDEVFDQPFVFHQLSEVMVRGLQLGRMGRVEQMEEVLSGVVQQVPGHPVPRYNLACAKARLGKTDEALEALDKAIDLGMAIPEQFAKDPDLATLRTDPRFDALLKKAAEATPFSVNLPQAAPLKPSRGVALVKESNTAWSPQHALLVGLFEFADQAPKVKEVVKGGGKAEDRVRQWFREGTAAGNYGDLYDNRDGDHSNLKYQRFPLLTRVEYSAEAKKRKLDWGAQTWFLYNAVTIGNASVAATGAQYWGSMARHAYVTPRSMAILHAQYRGNHLYLYPEHRDYDVGHNGEGGGYGDVFCANTPYVVISQGSSGSDKPFLDALTLTLAAFQPEVKKLLAQKGLLMPTLQMILRRTSRSVTSAKDYLSGIAHPTVFGQGVLDPLRMATLAHAITPDALPPLVVLNVVEEDIAQPGIDFFHNTPSEALCTTPGAIVRIVRSMKYERRMVLTAEESFDANGRPLSHHWRVLRGDADRIRINPLNDSGSEVELLIPYHRRSPIREGAKLASNRVDIGAFVHNGAHYSAPAFVSLFYLDNELREYDEAGRIRSVQYSGGTTPGNYVDPRIDTPKDWRDDYHYQPDGSLSGWTRTLTTGEVFEFAPSGRVVAGRDTDGKPTQTHQAIYLAMAGEDGLPLLVQGVARPPKPLGPRIENLP